MKALKFNLSGKTAFFKKPDVNSYLYFTYGNIHKVALLGMIGAILGLSGYSAQQEEAFPEFYSKLVNLKVSIVPINERGYIPKKVQVFNNSVGYASQEEGGNLIVKEQWLEEPSWDIYVMLNDESYGDEIKNRFLNYNFIYIPYLGKNDHFANIRDVEIVEIKEAENTDKIHSLFLKRYFEITSSDDDFDVFDDDSEYEEKWKYEEKLPIALEEVANQYIIESFIFTNMNVNLKEKCKLYSDEDRVIFFF